MIVGFGMSITFAPEVSSTQAYMPVSAYRQFPKQENTSCHRQIANKLDNEVFSSIYCFADLVRPLLPARVF